VEQLCNLLLAAAERRTGQSVGVNLNKARLLPLNRVGHPICEPTRESRFAGARRSRQNYQAVNRHHLEWELLPQVKSQQRLSFKPLTDCGWQFDSRPRIGEIGVWQVGLLDDYVHDFPQQFCHNTLI
jgi:hypothetical protein